MGGVDQGDAEVGDRLGCAVVLEVGGDQDVGPERRRRLGELAPGAAADRDPPDQAGRVAGRPDPPAGGRQRLRDRSREVAQGRRRGSAPIRPSPRSLAGSSGRTSLSPSASASASLTPGRATSALVCATYSATPLRDQPMHDPALRGRRGHRVGAAEEQRMVGDQQLRTLAIASSATASTGSTAKWTRLTSAAGSPQTRPTESHDSAQAGS